MKRFWNVIALTAITVIAAAPIYAQSPWIHVDVTEGGDDDTHVKVNLPLSVVQVALEAAPDKFVSDGEIHLDRVDKDLKIEDLRRMWNELRDAGDAEFISVEGEDETVSIRREGDMMHVDVEKNDDGGEKVRVDVPVSVVDALFSGSEGDSLNIEGALEQMRSQRGDIVRVDDGDTQVRIWIDERN